MKKWLKYLTVIAAVLLTVDAGSVYAQGGKSKKKTSTSKKAKGKSKGKAKSQQTAGVLVDTTAKSIVAAKKLELPIVGDTIRRSLRNDNAVERQLVKERVPLAYEHIREDDAVYRQRVWREIDTREKMNLPFRNRAMEDNGDQRFIGILLNSIRDSSITAFDPIDDRFTTPMPTEKIAEQLVGKSETVPVYDPVTGAQHDTTIYNDFNPDDIVKYQIKEEWVFDKESSRMFVRILGIAPLKIIRNSNGDVLGETPIFWVYYPDLRPTLAKYEAYNGRNYGSRMSWEELFESRMFSSYIVKSTIDNPYDQFIQLYVKDPILRLLESDNIKERIFNYEQDLWSY